MNVVVLVGKKPHTCLECPLCVVVECGWACPLVGAVNEEGVHDKCPLTSVVETPQRVPCRGCTLCYSDYWGKSFCALTGVTISFNKKCRGALQCPLKLYKP